MTEIVQIIPPTSGACGLQDYANSLTEAWSADFGVASRVFHLSESNRLENDLLQCFNQAARSKSVVLHYSGYGYKKRGAPLWLVRVMKKLRNHRPNIPWLTMFHEVAASGSIHTSAFWMRPLQIWVAKRLQRLSDATFTNCTLNANVLTGDVAGNGTAKIHIIPVFSNFGEPTSHIPVRYRQARLVIFTSNFGGRDPSQKFWLEVKQMIDLHHVTELVLVGRSLSRLPQLPVSVQQVGFLSAERVSELLEQSRFGYAFLGPLVLGKSGIFAAFAAHGVVPLVPVSDLMLPDGLMAGLHYLRCCEKSSLVEHETVQASLLKWYRGHDLATTVELYLGALDRLRNCCETL